MSLAKGPDPTEDTDSDEELPAGWEVRASLDGQVYYLNHSTKTSHWEHPISGKRSFIKPDLPPGWDMSVGCDGNLLFFDRVRGIRSHTDPRLAFSKSERDGGGGGGRTNWRQQFDSHSTALQVLANHDLTGRVALVTGASSGIGFETARAAALRGAKVVMACRSPQLGTAAVEKIRSEQPSADVEVWQLELTSLRSVLGFCRRYRASGYSLQALILNAGVCGPPHRVTEDGLELQFQVNHLSQLYLLRLLLPVLQASAPARVVLVSSESHRMPSVTRDTFDEAHLNLTDPKMYRGSAGLPQYGDTKLCNVLTARFIDRHFAAKGVRAFSVHPGNMVYTGIQRQWWLSRLVFVLARPFTKSVEQGAATSALAAFDPTIGQFGGGYFNNCTPCETSELGRDARLADKLWQLSDVMLRRCEAQLLATDDAEAAAAAAAAVSAEDGDGGGGNAASSGAPSLLDESAVALGTSE